MKRSKIPLLIFVLSLIWMLYSCDGAGKGGYFAGADFDSAPMSPGVEGAPSAGIPEGSDKEILPDKDEVIEGEDVILPDNATLAPGMITAGVWIDNNNYEMWKELFSQGQESLGKFYSFTNEENSWGFNSLRRIKVNVKKGEDPVFGATVVATSSDGEVLFTSVSDASGNAYLFTDADNGNITVTSGEGSASGVFDLNKRDINIVLDKCGEKLNVIEMMFLVDVTGSMGDEIDFLKTEIGDVINKIAEKNSDSAIKLSFLFYRDEYDAKPFDYYDFKDVTDPVFMKEQQAALDKQIADGGGDYPEAVDEALMLAVNKQWSSGATTKIIFQILDAPAHSDSNSIEKFRNAVNIAAEKGIRICPIICSGAAELTEYTMREASIYTGGAFIFVTNDSGIGNSHHNPQLPNVTVELLNSLIVRIVNGYHTGEFEAPVYWKNDPALIRK